MHRKARPPTRRADTAQDANSYSVLSLVHHAVQVALSRPEQAGLNCPFCNKSPCAVVYKAKTPSQRLAERSERANVESALLRARQVCRM